MPDHEAKTTLRVDPSSIQKPLKKLTCVKFVPTVCITLAPYKLRPCKTGQSQLVQEGDDSFLSNHGLWAANRADSMEILVAVTSAIAGLQSCVIVSAGAAFPHAH